MNLFENLQNMKENVVKLSNKELIKKYVNKLSDEEKEDFNVKNILSNLNFLSEDDNVIEELAIAIQDVLLDDNISIEPANDGTSCWFIYNESKTLKEYNSNINNKDQLYNEMLRYTEEPLVSFTDLFNCYSTDDLQYLYDYLSSEYEDDEFPVYRGKINNKDEMWNAMNELILPHEQQVGFDDLFNCYSLDKLKDLYDFLSSEYSYLDDYDEEFESKQLNESNNIVDDRKRMEYIVDIVNSLDDHLNTVDEISESLSKKIGKLYKMCSFLESIDEIKESTSGISGAYTTKSLDIKPE